jgi:cytoskeleton-associated protein 5
VSFKFLKCLTVQIVISGVKDLLEDLNPQLMNTILAEFDKVEGQSPPEPTRTSADLASVVASDSGASKKGGAGGADPLDDLFPRVELDGLLKGTSILADSKSDAWKTKKEALEMFQAILDQGPNKRLKPSMGEVSQVLKARVVDSNKAVQALALDIVGRIAMGMGKPFDKYTRFFTLPVVSVLSDAKAPPRNAAVATLTAMATACESLDTMMSDLVKGMETQNPMQRASLLAWLAMWYKDHEGTASSDLASFTGPILASLDDRSGDVRKSAQSMLPYLVVGAGYDYVMRQTDSLKAASKKSAVPLIQAAHAAAPAPAAASASKGSAKTAAAKPPKEVPQASPPPEEVSDRAPSRTGPAAPARKKLPIGLIKRPVESRAESPQEATAPARLAKPGTNGIKRVASAAAPRPTPAQSPSTTTGMLFHTISGDAKRARLAKDAQKWIVESGTTRKDLADLLQHQMEPHASRELVNLLFSHDHNAVNDHVAGLTMMTDFYASADTDDAKAICVANVDLPLKYVSMKGHEPQSNLISKNLDCVDAILELLQTAEHQLSEPEAMTFVPTLVYKVSATRPSNSRVLKQNWCSWAMLANLFAFECRPSYRCSPRSMHTIDSFISFLNMD